MGYRNSITQSAGDNSLKTATTEYVDRAVADGGGGGEDMATQAELDAVEAALTAVDSGFDARLDALEARADAIEDAATAISKNTQTDNYTLVLGDVGKVIEMDKATGVALTIPPNADVAIPVDSVLEVYAKGAGQVTLTPGAGVTIRGPSLTLRAQYSTASLRKRDTNEWVASGDLT